MRIAQVAPLAEAVPPKGYGGTERVVSWLTEELVARGHDVTLFASGDSQTAARHIAPVPRALRLEGLLPLYHAFQQLELEKVAQLADEFDVIHYHCDYYHFSLSRRSPTPQLTTLHGRLDLPELPMMFDEYREMPVVSISDAQRIPLPQANWFATVYHGLPLDLLNYSAQPEDYYAFLGRVCPEKRLDRAIEIANNLKIPLRVAAKIDPMDKAYYTEVIQPLLRGPYIDYIGEIGDKEKSAFLGGAKALLFPIDWPEPFGLTMIESLACGTPVVAFGHGSVPEVMDHGKTGFIVDNMADAITATERVEEIPRSQCRKVFERRFSVDAMTDAYEKLYARLVCTPDRKRAIRAA
jgi:glycosyltransferase involved in cell wall biosynthesis